MLHESVQFAMYQSQTTFHVVMVASEIDTPAPRIAIADLRTLDGIDQSVTLAQGEVQTGIHAWTAQHIVQQEQWHATRVVVAKGLDAQHDVSLVVGGLRFDVRGLRDDGRRTTQNQTAFHYSFIVHTPFEHLHHAVEVDVAIDEEDGVVGMVVTLGETTGVERGELLHLLARTQDVMTQRMPTEDQVFELVVNQFGRRVIITLYFVADDVDFTFYLVLGIFTAKNNVAKQVDSPRKVFALDSRIEHRIFLVGKGIQVASHTLQTIQDLQGRAPMGSLKRGVFAKVGQSFFAWCLMTGSGIDADATINHW